MSHSPRRDDTSPERGSGRALSHDVRRYLVPSLGWLAATALAGLYPMVALYALVGILVLSPAVLLHEWGHYRVARKSGLDVKEFSIGFGPRLLTRARDGVQWSLKAIPLGGSVSVAGMTVEQAQQEQTARDKAFVYAPVRTRIRLALAGVAINLALAWLALSIASVALAPEDIALWKVLLIAPLGGLVVLARFIQVALVGLASALYQWDADVSTIVILPHALESGVATAETTGIPLWCYFTLIFGLLNLSLAIFNLLPLYPLDGYHAAIATADGIRRRRRTRRMHAHVQPLRLAQLSWYNRTTGILLGIFVVSLLGRDIIRIFQGTLP